MGGKIVTVVPSTVGKIVPMGSPADEWRWCVEALKECQAHAETVGVRIGLEPLNRFETYFLNRCDQALALADAVGGDCGVALDAFHMNIEESDLLAAIRAAGDRLVDFHVADNNRMPPGHGALDWNAIVAELVGIGYDGHLTVEFVASVDRSAISERQDIGDASEAGGGAAVEKFLRDHSTGAVPEAYYDRYAQESIDHLRAALAAADGGVMPDRRPDRHARHEGRRDRLRARPAGGAARAVDRDRLRHPRRAGDRARHHARGGRPRRRARAWPTCAPRARAARRWR